MLDRAKQRLPHEQVDKLDWYWPVGEKIPRNPVSDTVRLLAPFDPLVHDRARFELLWGWSYRFEAYTPATKRKLGYYAMPMLWRDAIVGWANLSVKGGRLAPDIGFVGEPIRERTFKQELERELESLTKFLRLNE
jgi:hypothetical protein